VVEVRPDKVTVLADDAESASEIDLNEIEEARERARRLMSESPTENQRAEIAQELRRVEIAAKVKRRLPSAQRSIRSIDDD
jgi:F-type H+-transporting ATPase subunit epsilon